MCKQNVNFYNELLVYASSMVWNIKFIKYRENKLAVIRYVQNVHHWQKHKHASILVVSQRRHQSATASSLAAHAADAVAAHQCYESDSDVVSVRSKIHKSKAYLQKVFIPVSRYVKILKSIKIFQSYDHKCTATSFYESQCRKKVNAESVYTSYTVQLSGELYVSSVMTVHGKTHFSTLIC